MHELILFAGERGRVGTGEDADGIHRGATDLSKFLGSVRPRLICHFTLEAGLDDVGEPSAKKDNDLLRIGPSIFHYLDRAFESIVGPGGTSSFKLVDLGSSGHSYPQSACLRSGNSCTVYPPLRYMSFPTLSLIPYQRTSPTRHGPVRNRIAHPYWHSPRHQGSCPQLSSTLSTAWSYPSEPIGSSIEPDTSNTSVKSIGWVVVTVVVLEAPFTSTFTV